MQGQYLHTLCEMQENFVHTAIKLGGGSKMLSTDTFRISATDPAKEKN